MSRADATGISNQPEPAIPLQVLTELASSGNLAITDVVYLLNDRGIAHGIDPPRLIGAGTFPERRLQACCLFD